jgi:hypothetical protein
MGEDYAEKKKTLNRGLMAAGVFAAIIVLMLSWATHKEHIMEFAPYLILLLCPVMHLFMHGKHGKH